MTMNDSFEERLASLKNKSKSAPKRQVEITFRDMPDEKQKIYRLYDEGRYEESYPGLLRLAKSGDGTSANNLGNLYYDGKGVAQDYVQALEWY